MQIGEHLFPTDITNISDHDGKFNSMILVFQRAEKSETIVGENLGKYIISTGKANIVILTRVLAIIFTKYNRGFCLNLWDPGGQSYKCSCDYQPMILFQSIVHRLILHYQGSVREATSFKPSDRSPD